MSGKRLVTGLLGLALLTFATPPAHADQQVRVLGVRTVPNALPFAGTTVGGLSGIDYDYRTGQYVLLSDDRSQLQPARFYTAKIPVTARGLGEVTFTGTHALTQPDGSTYPTDAVDPEELRVDPWCGTYYWSQEGDRSGVAATPDPSVREATRTGAYVRDLPIPENERVSETAGPRPNQVLEAMTFAAAGSLVVTALEGPLQQDGPEATPEHGALSRITVQSRFGPVLRQYAYQQEPVFATPAPGGSANNGVVSILAAGGDPARFLVLERAYVSGVGNRVRIFEIDTRGASNVLAVPSLADAPEVKPVRKKLVADLADLPIDHVDNVEGMTWGPRLATGERSLLLVSDDNFSSGQVTQVIALAMR
ncbi:esterase-like activity of phytase family protein [Saccharomonospora sp. NPDC046836]|uniref:esterase-like activity of phytase family protein n=1 Tax=Saccharomonospora sp. NPDC046836 TaxID=3156921 RepID=UPI00340FA241